MEKLTELQVCKVIKQRNPNYKGIWQIPLLNQQTCEKNNQLYLRAEEELEVHIWWFCSTIEYFKTTEYELPTPSQRGDRHDYCFHNLHSFNKGIEQIPL